ncbi:hypothetical protein [Streptomyces sp. NPDC058657]|uniref:hypothetical protein n=1 Tax=unclassified Streptomyces TaxID=2593676 RepID=UPI00364F4562
MSILASRLVITPRSGSNWTPDDHAYEAATLRDEIMPAVQRFLAEHWGDGIAVTFTADQDDEKDTRGSVPHEGESTRHALPCEFPEVLPCRCPVRPRVLPDASTARATSRAGIAAFFRGVQMGHTTESAVTGA